MRSARGGDKSRSYAITSGFSFCVITSPTNQWKYTKQVWRKSAELDGKKTMMEIKSCGQPIIK